MKFQKLKEKLGIKQTPVEKAVSTLPEVVEPETAPTPVAPLKPIKEKLKFDKGFRNHIGDLYHTKRV